VTAGPSRGRAHLALLGYALGAIRRRAGRTAALLGGLAAAVALLSAVVFLTDALRAEARRARGAAADLVLQRLQGGRPALVDPAVAERVARMPGVAAATPRVWGYVFLPSIQGNVTVVGLPRAGPAPLPGLALASGRAPAPGERGACLLGRDLAVSIGLRTGDKLRFPAPDDRGPACKVVGLFSSAVALFTSDVVLMDEDDARAVLLLPAGSATDIAVTLTTPDESSVLAGELVGLFPGARVVERALLERVHALAYGRRSGFVLGASLPALLALLVLAYDRASGLGAAERREIAVLKAAGWSSADVLTEKLYESLLVALTATTLGLVAGYAWAFWLGAPGLREALAGWSTLYPSLRLTPEVTFAQLLGLSTLVAAPYVALSIGPAWRAASLDPMEALRGSLPHGTTLSSPASPASPAGPRSPAGRMLPRPGGHPRGGAARPRVAPRRRGLQQRSPVAPRSLAEPRLRRHAAGLRGAPRRRTRNQPPGPRHAHRRRPHRRVPPARPAVPPHRHRRGPLRRRSRRRQALRAVPGQRLGRAVHRRPARRRPLTARHARPRPGEILAATPPHQLHRSPHGTPSPPSPEKSPA
jgi:ABC-type lipoprotein release transport system permease subunit